MMRSGQAGAGEKRDAPDDALVSPSKGVDADQNQPVLALVSTTASALVLGSASQETQFSSEHLVQDAIAAIQKRNLKLLYVFLHPHYELRAKKEDFGSDSAEKLRTKRRRNFTTNIEGTRAYEGLPTRYNETVVKILKQDEKAARAKALATAITESNFNANTCDVNGQSLLYHAVASGDVDIVKALLLDPKADLYRGQGLGFYPVKLANDNNLVEIIQLLAAHRKEYGLADGQIIRTPDVTQQKLQYTPWSDIPVESVRSIQNIFELLDKQRLGFSTGFFSLFTSVFFKADQIKFYNELNSINDTLIPNLEFTRDVSKFVSAIVEMASKQDASSYIKETRTELVDIQRKLDGSLQLAYAAAQKAIVPVGNQATQLLAQVEIQTAQLQQARQAQVEQQRQRAEDLARQEATEVETAMNSATLKAMTAKKTPEETDLLVEQARLAKLAEIEQRKQARAARDGASSSSATTNGLYLEYVPNGARSGPATPPRTLGSVLTGATPGFAGMNLNGGAAHTEGDEPGTPTKRRKISASSASTTGQQN